MNNSVYDEQIFRYRYRIFVQVIKIVIIISLAIILASLIYAYYHYISAKEWKIVLTFLEAKMVGLFINKKAPSYIVAYLNIDKILIKLQYALYQGLKLARTLYLITLTSVIFYLWLREKILSDNPYPQFLKSEVKLQTKEPETSNQLKSSIMEEPEEFIKIKNI